MQFFSVKDAPNTILPLCQSASYSPTDEALNALFVQVYFDLFNDKVANILNYGTPTYAGSRELVERFAKQHGLVFYNKPNTPNGVVNILYDVWQSLSSKRGLDFLHFVMTALWGNDGYYLHHTYHSIAKIGEYPAHLSHMEQAGDFMTSRIIVGVYGRENASELQKITPILQQIAPANLVIDVLSAIDLGALHLNIDIGLTVTRG